MNRKMEKLIQEFDEQEARLMKDLRATHIINIQEVVELRDKNVGVFQDIWLEPFDMPYSEIALLFEQDGYTGIIFLEELREPWVSISFMLGGVLIYLGEINFRFRRDGAFHGRKVRTNPKCVLPIVETYGKEGTRALIERDMQLAVELAKASISLMHVKNVTLEDYDPNEHISRQVRRARERKGLGPLIKYKILHIKPWGKQPKNPASGNKTGVKQAVHTTRGHFRTYAADKPAFGKPWGVGTFWVGPHVRGNPEFGLVMKDYHIEIDEAVLIPVNQERRDQCH